MLLDGCLEFLGHERLKVMFRGAVAFTGIGRYGTRSATAKALGEVMGKPLVAVYEGFKARLSNIIGSRIFRSGPRLGFRDDLETRHP